jgi:RNA-directed DNA polymerase
MAKGWRRGWPSCTNARKAGGIAPRPPNGFTFPRPTDDNGQQRPIGIASLEDKVLQQAVGQVLGAIWEEDFANFSYGFRPGRSQHNALDALWVGITQRRVNWVLDADIRSFFDTLDHSWLMKFVEHRVADTRMQSLIRGWLRAGVSEDGKWSRTTEKQRGHAARGGYLTPSG